MAAIGIGINTEFVRSVDKPFEYAVEEASRLGYEYLEPCLMTGRDLLAEAGYYHFRTTEEDGIEVRDATGRGWTQAIRSIGPRAADATGCRRSIPALGYQVCIGPGCSSRQHRRGD